MDIFILTTHVSEKPVILEYDVTLWQLSTGILRTNTRHEVEASYHSKCLGTGIVSWPAIYGESFVLFCAPYDDGIWEWTIVFNQT